MLNKSLAEKDSLSVLKNIVSSHSNISSIKVIAHGVEENWRQINSSPSSKIKNLSKGLMHDNPEQVKLLTREEFLSLGINNLQNLNQDMVWSFVSKVQCSDGTIKHIPMMNFHPEGVGLDAIKEAIKKICSTKEGYILDSGRFFHYYGNFLLSEEEWRKFMAEFLMPCVLVSPRYIGHRLYDGYCTLRLTTQKPHKPKLPKIIAII